MKTISNIFKLKFCFAVFALIMMQLTSFSQPKDKDKKEDWPKHKFDERPDSTYGKGGRVLIDTTFFKDGSYIVHWGYRDKGKKFMQSTEKFYNSEEGSESTTTEYYDTSGKKIKETSVTKNRIGDETYNREEFYKDGIIDSGDMYYDSPGVKGKIHKKYNRETQKWEYVEPENGKEGNKEGEKINPDVTSYLFLGGSFINEDNNANRFNTYGGTIVYNKNMNGKFGITGEVGIYFGKNNGNDYTKFQVLGGVSLFPQVSDKIFISPHVLAGITHLKTEYGNTYSYTGTSFALAAGTDIGVPVSHRVIINLRTDYNPTFYAKNVQNNFWISAGLYIRF
jgi:hypothetical protein